MKYILTSVLIGLIFFARSQGIKLEQISLVGGKNFSSFIYKDSDGTKDKGYDMVALNSFGINAGFASGHHVLRPEIQFRQAGAKSSDLNGLALSWKMNYIDISVGYLYSVLKTDRFSISPGLALGYGYMLNGEQFIGEKRYSIPETNSLSRHDLAFKALTNFQVQISEDLNLGLEYRFTGGIMQIEKDSTPQKTHNLSHSALLVLGIKIK
jgi:hypothetical protein